MSTICSMVRAGADSNPRQQCHRRGGAQLRAGRPDCTALAGTLALLLTFLLAGCGKPLPPPPPPPPLPKVAPPVKKEPVIPRAEIDVPSPECAEHDQQLGEAFAPYVDAFSNIGIELSPDGKLLLFRSNRGGGSAQLYVAPADRPAAAPTAIAPAKDGVADARFTPDGKYVLFLRDKDRNENTQIYRATVDGKEVVPLTTELRRYHHLPEVTADGGTLVHFRGVHKSPDTYLVSQPIDGGEARVVSKGKGSLILSALTRDGQQALVYQWKSCSESVLFRVDIGSGKTTRLAPTAGQRARVHRAVYGHDEKFAFLISDEGSERAVLNRIELESGKVNATFQDDEAEVARVVSSPAAPLVAVVLDHGSHHRLKLLDGDSLKERAAVKLPLGTVVLGRFTSDGAGLVVTVSAPSAPSDVFLVDTRSGRIRPLRRDPRPGLGKLARVKASIERIDSFDGLKVPLNLYLPQRRLPRGKRLPVIVSVHGGPAYSSSVEWDPYVSFWISKGFAVVEPNVRGSTGFGKEYEKADNGKLRMNAIRDLAEVNKWIRAQPWADPQRLVVHGFSYGGYMTYMALGHQPELWRAGIGLAGIVNLRTLLATTTGAIRLVSRDEFGDLERDGPFLDSISPISVAGQMKAPLFIYQGENDPRVPRSEQDQLVLALRRRGVAVEYIVAHDEGHSLSQRGNKMQFAGRSVRFLQQHLDLPGLPGECWSTAATVTPRGDP